MISENAKHKRFFTDNSNLDLVLDNSTGTWISPELGLGRIGHAFITYIYKVYKFSITKLSRICKCKVVG